MPRLDGTGPIGQGALTGQGRGNCSSFASQSEMGWGCRRGIGRGMRDGTGMGRGRRLNSDSVQSGRRR